MSAYCVFCSSSQTVDRVYLEAAKDVGRELAARQHTTVYGGCNVGLMLAVADAAYQNEGRVVGIIPKKIHQAGFSWEKCHKLIITTDMRERKATMAEQSDGFIILPGGFGTLEEFFEMVTQKQLGYFDKPIVLINTNEFFSPLLQQLEIFYSQNFANEHYRSTYEVVSNAQEAMIYLDAYESGQTIEKY